MNSESAAFLRAVKGPVMMITVGVLFALDNFTPLSFGRTWPVLLVVAGILCLGRGACSRGPGLQGKTQYRAQWGPPRPPVPPPPPFTAAPETVNPTAPPGTYRGSAYEATPGSPSRSSQARNSETRSRPEPSATVPPSDPGATQ